MALSAVLRISSFKRTMMQTARSTQLGEKAKQSKKTTVFFAASH